VPERLLLLEVLELPLGSLKPATSGFGLYKDQVTSQPDKSYSSLSELYNLAVKVTVSFCAQTPFSDNNVRPFSLLSKSIIKVTSVPDVPA
jgi:hypothetical protein